MYDIIWREEWITFYIKDNFCRKYIGWATGARVPPQCTIYGICGGRGTLRRSPVWVFQFSPAVSFHQRSVFIHLSPGLYHLNSRHHHSRGADKPLARPTSLSIVFAVQGTDGSPTGPDPENRVYDQDIGSPGRPVSSGLQVPGEPFPSWSG
jgi:hypothetical protein